jgi:thymidylate synthase
MSLGFPVLTTKKVHFKSIVSELLWFMRGQTDLRTLLQQKNTIWVGDAYKRYVRHAEILYSIPLTKDQFIERILEDDDFSEKFGECGPIYGAQWRGYNAITNPKLVKHIQKIDPDAKCTLNNDQLADAIAKLRTNSYDRRIIVDSWNPEAIPFMVLPPCHLYFQFFVRPMSNQEKKRNQGYHQKLDLIWFQRSVDTFLGLPFNIASYALLLELIARMIQCEAGGNLKFSNR